jgi:hypothetical protein
MDLCPEIVKITRVPCGCGLQVDYICTNDDKGFERHTRATGATSPTKIVALYYK